MVCRLCLENSSEVLEMFNNKGRELRIATVIGKHFWFEPKNEDPISSNICHCCWTKVYDFHEFYKCVEKAQQLLTVEVVVKTETYLSIFENVELPNKHELDNIEELYEQPLNNSSDVLAEDNDGEGEFEYENINNENDDKDSLDDKEDASDLQFKINEKNNVLRKKRTKLKRSCKRNKLDSLSEEETSTYKERGRQRQRKGKAALMKNKSNCNLEKAAKVTSDKDESRSSGTTLEMSEIINRKISEYMPLKCDICGIDLATFAHIRSHMRTVHDVQPYVKCCEKKFTRRALLYDHIMFHLNPDIYKCEKCDNKLFSDKRTFKYHNIVKHQSEDNKIYQCSQCPKKFAKKYLLHIHKTHHNNELQYFCSECEKGFPYMSALTSHTSSVHGDYGIMCDICSKIVKGPAAFKRHQLEHQGIVEPKVQCDLCGSWHKDKSSLAKHKRRHKYQEQPQVCNICNKTCVSREALYRHKRFVHESNGKYECNICKKSFKMPNSLKEHMSQHTGLALYRCPHCSRTFNNSSNMHKHRKHTHPKEFEEFRRLRKISARSKEPILPTISFLSDATKASGELHPFSCSVIERIKEKQAEHAEYNLDTLC